MSFWKRIYGTGKTIVDIELGPFSIFLAELITQEVSVRP